MEPIVLVKVIGFLGLGILCLVSAISSWQTRRLLVAVFGKKPRAAQLSQRGYYLPLPEQARPVVAPMGSSGARALGPTVEPAAALAPARAVEPAAVEPAAIEPGATSAPTGSADPSESSQPPSLAPAELPARPAIRPPPLAREEPEPRREHAPETTRKPGAAPSSRKRPAVTAPTDLAALVLELDHADQAQAVQAPERRVASERPPAASTAQALAEPSIRAAGLGERPRETRSEFPPPHKPPHLVRKATMVGIQPPSVPPPPMVAPASARSLPAATPPPVRAFYASPPALAATVVAARRRVSANGGDNADRAAPLAPPRSLPLATADDFDSDDETTKVMDLPTAEALGLERPRARGRATTLVSATAGVPSSARREPDVKVIGADTPSKPGETTAPVVAP
jgi:hypothetical protein